MRDIEIRALRRSCPEVTDDRDHRPRAARGAQSARRRRLRRAPPPLPRALRAGASAHARRRPHELDDALVKPVPAVRRRGARRPLHLRRRTRVRRLLPRRHGRDDRPLPRRLGPGHRGSGRPRHHDHAAHRGLPLGRRRAQPSLRPAVLAAGAHGDGRQPLRRAPRPSRHEASEDPRLQLLLSRLRGRDHHHDQRRRAGAQAGQRRSASRSDGDEQGRRVERPRGAGAGARARRRGLRPRRAGAHQHRHHPA